MLIAFRCLQGVGASAIMANTMPLITHFTPIKTRGVAIGFVWLGLEVDIHTSVVFVL